MGKKIFCIGHSSYDVVIPVEKFPVENFKYSLSSSIECGGGPAGNVAYLLSKWGIECSFIGWIGNDIFGKRIKEEFKKVGTDLRYLRIKKNIKTPYSFILVNKNNGSRTLFNINMSKSNIRTHLDNEFIPDIILVDGHELGASLKAIDKFPNAITVLDAGSFNKDTELLASKVDYLICSEDFAKSYCKISQIKNIEEYTFVYRKLEKLNNNNIIITLGERGCLYKDENLIKRVPALRIKPVDTTGAGDIFHGAFVYSLAQEYSLIKTLKFASRAAGLSVKKFGGRLSIPELQEVLEDF